MKGRTVVYGARDVSYAVSKDMNGRRQRKAVGGTR